MKRIPRIIWTVACFACAAVMAGCGSKKDEAVKTDILVVNEIKDAVATDKNGVMIGEADLVIPDTAEELEEFITQIR